MNLPNFIIVIVMNFSLPLEGNTTNKTKNTTNATITLLFIIIIMRKLIRNKSEL